MSPFKDSPEGKTNYCPLCEEANRRIAALKKELNSWKETCELLEDKTGATVLERDLDATKNELAALKKELESEREVREQLAADAVALRYEKECVTL